MSRMGRIKADRLSIRVVKIIERSREKRSAEDHTWSNGDLAHDLFLAAAKDPTLPDLKTWAEDQVKIWDEGLRPIGSDEPGFSFYQADAQVPLGKSQRVKMRDINAPEQLFKWQRIETTQFAPQMAAYNRKITYIASRHEAWAKHPECKTLDELESKYF